MKQNVTLMDGAVGTSLWAKAEANGFQKDPVWKYNMEHPEIVAELAAEYADESTVLRDHRTVENAVCRRNVMSSYNRVLTVAPDRVRTSFRSVLPPFT